MVHATLALTAVGAAAALVATPKVTQQYVVSERPYEVLPGSTAQERAEFLYRLETWARDFLEAASARWPSDARLRRIRQRWTGHLNEVVGQDDAAYSAGKRAIYVCVWNKQTGQLESFDASRYILLHEFAHVATVTWGHDEAFWTNFKALLEMAEALGKYTHSAHEPEATYCGHRIGRSPASCVLKKTCDSAL